MAIARGAGTEIIRSIHLEDVDSTHRFLIIGEQHHIYTVLSITVMAYNIQAAGNYVRCYLLGYDSLVGETQEDHYIFHQDMQALQTFVWNDKFSFNGVEPTGTSGAFGAGDAAADLAYQNALADQGGSAITALKIYTENASDGFDVTCTYIDQNNN